MTLLIGNITATIVFYAVASVLDVALFVVWLSRALSYSKRAGRGETFVLNAARSPGKQGEFPQSTNPRDALRSAPRDGA